MNYTFGMHLNLCAPQLLWLQCAAVLKVIKDWCAHRSLGHCYKVVQHAVKGMLEAEALKTVARFSVVLKLLKLLWQCTGTTWRDTTLEIIAAVQQEHHPGWYQAHHNASAMKAGNDGTSDVIVMVHKLRPKENFKHLWMPKKERN